MSELLALETVVLMNVIARLTGKIFAADLAQKEIDYQKNPQYECKIRNITIGFKLHIRNGIY